MSQSSSLCSISKLNKNSMTVGMDDKMTVFDRADRSDCR